MAKKKKKQMTYTFELPDRAQFEKEASAMKPPLKLAPYTVARLPDAAKWSGHLVYVTDETGGAVTAVSDGVNWRRQTDRAVVA